MLESLQQHAACLPHVAPHSTDFDLYGAVAVRLYEDTGRRDADSDTKTLALIIQPRSELHGDGQRENLRTAQMGFNPKLPLPRLHRLVGQIYHSDVQVNLVEMGGTEAGCRRFIERKQWVWLQRRKGVSRTENDTCSLEKKNSEK